MILSLTEATASPLTWTSDLFSLRWKPWHSTSCFEWGRVPLCSAPSAGGAWTHTAQPPCFVSGFFFLNKWFNYHCGTLLSPAPPWCDTPWAGNHVIVFILGTAHGFSSSYHHCYNYARRHKWCSRVPSSHLTQHSRDTDSAGVAVELFCFMFAIWWLEWAVTCLVFFFSIYFFSQTGGKRTLKPTTFSLVSCYSDLNNLNGSQAL